MMEGNKDIRIYWMINENYTTINGGGTEGKEEEGF